VIKASQKHVVRQNINLRILLSIYSKRFL